MSGAFKAGAVSLSELGPYGFWSRDVIGGSDSDAAAAEAGTLSDERREQLVIAGLAARDALMDLEVPGIKDWMPPARRLN